MATCIAVASVADAAATSTSRRRRIAIAPNVAIFDDLSPWVHDHLIRDIVDNIDNVSCRMKLGVTYFFE